MKNFILIVAFFTLLAPLAWADRGQQANLEDQYYNEVMSNPDLRKAWEANHTTSYEIEQRQLRDRLRNDLESARNHLPRQAEEFAKNSGLQVVHQVFGLGPTMPPVNKASWSYGNYFLWVLMRDQNNNYYRARFPHKFNHPKTTNGGDIDPVLFEAMPQYRGKTKVDFQTVARDQKFLAQVPTEWCIEQSNANYLGGLNTGFIYWGAVVIVILYILFSKDKKEVARNKAILKEHLE